MHTKISTKTNHVLLPGCLQDVLTFAEVWQRFEDLLNRTIPDLGPRATLLTRAQRHIINAGGKRLRPSLLLLVFNTCSVDKAGLELALLAACSLELFHTASLVHDDLPCFDNADMRRGLPTLHRKFGEPIAVLAGDALIVRALQLIASSPPSHAHEAMEIVKLLGDAVAGEDGVIAGQAMEEQLELIPPDQSAAESLTRYHYRKTAALFRAACTAGAIAARVPNAQAWASLGGYIGKYYQLADDLIDCYANPAQIGKPVHQDVDRLNMVTEVGADMVRSLMERALRQARETIIALADSPDELLSWVDRLVASVESALPESLIAN
ncbi:MAG: polyprenyl synthetase family protein [Silvibacterium sp.]|nr:polyprenyl synthetase family protein [Silvibacterium sp.]